MRFSETYKEDFIQELKGLPGVWLAPNGSEWSTEKTETCCFFFGWDFKCFPPDTAESFVYKEVERFKPEYLFNFTLESEIDDKKFNEYIKEEIKISLAEWQRDGKNPVKCGFTLTYDNQIIRVLLCSGELDKWKAERTGKRIKQDRWDD